MDPWLMHERRYFRLMAAEKCKIRTDEEKEQQEAQKGRRVKEMTEKVIE